MSLSIGNRLDKLLFLCLAFTPLLAIAEEKPADPEQKEQIEPESKRTYSEQNWGIAMGMRYAEIPYATGNGDRTVADIVPLMFFENDYFYIRGLEGGVKIINKEQWKLNAILRYRFFDIPAEYQNQVKGDAWDGGIQLR